MCRGYELSERKTEIKPIVSLISFFHFFIIIIIVIFITTIIITIYYAIIFSSGGFSEKGCHVVTSKSNSEETVCSCNHLTHFAVLLDYNGSPGVMSLFSPYLFTLPLTTIWKRRLAKENLTLWRSFPAAEK